jgi:uncharacterized protein (TIGR00159 family)
MFFEIRVLDIVDILLVAYILYRVYKWIRGTVAISIFIGLFSIYALWFIVRAFKMELLSAILGQVLGVGVLALFIVFQKEIRNFLLYIGSQYDTKQFSFMRLFSKREQHTRVNIPAIVCAAENMAEKCTGALIVIRRENPLDSYKVTGDVIDAITSNRLLENIFFKNSPLHDGAVIIENEVIAAARCVLPITEQVNLPSNYGMRHRAALGISETTDAIVVVVSEETGSISLAAGNKINYNITPAELQRQMAEALK